MIRRKPYGKRKAQSGRNWRQRELWMGGPRAHMPALVALPEVDVVAVCTAHEETARESAEKYGVPQAYHNHMDMLSQLRPL